MEKCKECGKEYILPSWRRCIVCDRKLRKQKSKEQYFKKKHGNTKKTSE